MRPRVRIETEHRRVRQIDFGAEIGILGLQILANLLVAPVDTCLPKQLRMLTGTPPADLQSGFLRGRTVDVVGKPSDLAGVVLAFQLIGQLRIGLRTQTGDQRLLLSQLLRLLRERPRFL
jgi:hypothetical protein